MKNFFSVETMAVDAGFEDPSNGFPSSSASEPQGVCCLLGGNCIGLFVLDDRLFLYLNGRASEVIGRRVSASLQKEGAMHRLELTIDGVNQRIDYKQDQTPVSTQFYSEDEEDADYGLWLTNILASQERRELFVQSWRTH
jgi:hypothetical protein